MSTAPIVSASPETLATASSQRNPASSSATATFNAMMMAGNTATPTGLAQIAAVQAAAGSAAVSNQLGFDEVRNLFKRISVKAQSLKSAASDFVNSDQASPNIEQVVAFQHDLAETAVYTEMCSKVVGKCAATLDSLARN